jgi:hypothetical protein
MPEPWRPDWTLAPAALLRDWMEENGVSIGLLAGLCGRGDADIKAGLIIKDVLGRKPLMEAHAEILERGTGIPARTWLNSERIYREDLAADRTDTTEDDDEVR